VNQSLLLPGDILLAPGRYVLETLANSSTESSAVMIWSVDDPHLAGRFVQARPTTREDAGPTIDIRAAHGQSVAELASWYPGGGTSGYAFAPQSDPEAQHTATLEVRLREAETTVSEAQRQLNAAMAKRDALRAERASGR
jgi:hypothetical protein